MKFFKDVLFVVGCFLAVLVAVMAWHWEDTANTKFWWSFWPVAGVIAIIGCFAGWLYLNSKTKK